MSESPFPLQPVIAPESPEQRFEKFLRARGKRITAQRRLIVATIFSHHDHFDADDLMVHLRDRMASREVSRPTVYRTLGELVEAGLLRRMTLRDRYVYEHAYGYPDHDHLYCQVCHRLIEFYTPLLEEIREQVSREHGFHAVSHRLLISGICENCFREQNKSGSEAEQPPPSGQGHGAGPAGGES
ncbi:MAG: transcriptional repressor [Thermogutta sp.]|nr:transcriptional repressor [Thermogutta sp.]